MIRREEWRPIDSWPYEVSSFGRVRRTRLKNKKRDAWNPNSYEGKILRPTPDKNGYLIVDLNDKNRHLTAKIAQLVCTAFNGPKPKGCRLVRHLNNDKTCNRPHNLKWGTHLDNYKDRVAAGVGALAKIPAEDLRDFLRRYREEKAKVGKVIGLIPEYSVRFGISGPTLWKYANGYSQIAEEIYNER